MGTCGNPFSSQGLGKTNSVARGRVETNSVAKGQVETNSVARGLEKPIWLRGGAGNQFGCQEVGNQCGCQWLGEANSVAKGRVETNSVARGLGKSIQFPGASENQFGCQGPGGNQFGCQWAGGNHFVVIPPTLLILSVPVPKDFQPTGLKRMSKRRAEKHVQATGCCCSGLHASPTIELNADRGKNDKRHALNE